MNCGSILIKTFVHEQIEELNETDRRNDGATGAPLGVSLLQALREMPGVETHLVLSKWAKTTIELETPYSVRDVSTLADYCHNPADRPRPSPPDRFVLTA